MINFMLFSRIFHVILYQVQQVKGRRSSNICRQGFQNHWWIMTYISLFIILERSNDLYKTNTSEGNCMSSFSRSESSLDYDWLHEYQNMVINKEKTLHCYKLCKKKLISGFLSVDGKLEISKLSISLEL